MIGYDKSAMVFHMLRGKVGEPIFWNALRDFYDQFRFKRASWSDLRKVFKNRFGQSLNPFFNQWVDRPGASRLHLEGAHYAGNDKVGYRVTGHLVQGKPYFNVTLELVIETTDDIIKKRVHLAGQQTKFVIETSGKPRKISADPEYHLFMNRFPLQLGWKCFGKINSRF